MESCRHFGVCGGCSLLDQPIESQLAHKAARLTDVLAEHLGNVQIQTPEVHATPLHDRTRILYPVQPDDHGHPTLGIYKKGTHDLVRVRECRIQLPALTELGSHAETIFRDHGLVPYDETSHSGSVRAFSARCMPGTDELLLGIVTATTNLQSANSLTRALRDATNALDNSTQLVGIVHNVNTARGNALLGPRTSVLWGHDHQYDDCDGLRFRVSFTSFYQLHRNASRLLYDEAMSMLGAVNGCSVVDAYGGVGTFGLRLSQLGADSVTIVEDNAAACRDAEHNMVINAHCLRGLVQVRQQRFEQLVGDELPADLLVVDPSRAGLRASGAATVLALAPERILYVSCNPESLARDLQRLRPYRLKYLQLVDLFPHTEHMEVLALLDRCGSRS